LYIIGTVVGLVVYLRVSQRPVVPKGLQRAWADVEYPAHVLIVHPLVYCLLSVPLTDGIHATDETVELGDHRLKGVSFAAKEYIICYPAMDFPEVEACGTGR